MAKDYRARYGYQPTWEKQRKKQREVAANYYARLYGEVEVPEPEADDG